MDDKLTAINRMHSEDIGHATSTPDVEQTVKQVPSVLIPDILHQSGFDIVSLHFDA